MTLPSLITGVSLHVGLVLVVSAVCILVRRSGFSMTGFLGCFKSGAGRGFVWSMNRPEYRAWIEKTDQNKAVIRELCFHCDQQWLQKVTWFETQTLPPPPSDCSKVDNTIHQALLVQRVDNVIRQINRYPVDSIIITLNYVLLTLIRSIAIYLVDSVTQPVKNRGQINHYPVENIVLLTLYAW